MVFIDNTAPRRDVTGALMDVHDGTIVQWKEGELFYWYGIGYKDCEFEWIPFPPQYCKGVWQPFGGCGFRTDHSLSVYSSPDLVSWTYEGNGLPLENRPEGIYFRPKVIFDNKTAEYVLWVNYLRKSGSTWASNTPLTSYMSNISYIVARSSTVTGPFTVVDTVWQNTQIAQPGDNGLIVGREGAAYLVYDAW